MTSAVNVRRASRRSIGNALRGVPSGHVWDQSVAGSQDEDDQDTDYFQVSNDWSHDRADDDDDDGDGTRSTTTATQPAAAAMDDASSAAGKACAFSPHPPCLPSSCSVRPPRGVFAVTGIT